MECAGFRIWGVDICPGFFQRGNLGYYGMRNFFGNGFRGYAAVVFMSHLLIIRKLDYI